MDFLPAKLNKLLPEQIFQTHGLEGSHDKELELHRIENTSIIRNQLFIILITSAGDMHFPEKLSKTNLDFLIEQLHLYQLMTTVGNIQNCTRQPSYPILGFIGGVENTFWRDKKLN
ncbi:XH/XS domain-containing protein [Striga asiatica]|uniref:XH/XS domain-containing protein n=1 Tax=Striga asiatica TaxID=4170 RepID=A0A5A7R2P0_STRAF|nr:XH/XS domain-containing protein [Striga asiatica]